MLKKEIQPKYEDFRQLSQRQKKILKWYEKKLQGQTKDFLEFYEHKSFYTKTYNRWNENPIYLYLFEYESLEKLIFRTFIIYEYDKNGILKQNKDIFSKYSQKVLLNKINNYKHVLKILDKIEKLENPLRGRLKHSMIKIDNNFLWNLYNKFINKFHQEELNKILDKITKIENEEKNQMTIWNNSRKNY